MNTLLIGTADKDFPTEEPFLLIDDGPIADEFLEQFDCKLFNPYRHSFNPLDGIDYRRARDITDTIYSASPQGENTLTVRNGKRALARLLLANTTRLDNLPAEDEEATATVQDLLLSPILKRVLCRNPNFSFTGSIVAKLDRAKLGDFDCFILAQLLIGQHKGQVIVPDFGFYGRDFHVSLIRQNRLTCGVNYLAELPPKLQQAVLTIKDKKIYRTTKEDAERLITYTSHLNPAKLSDQQGEEFTEGF